MKKYILFLVLGSFLRAYEEGGFYRMNFFIDQNQVEFSNAKSKNTYKKQGHGYDLAMGFEVNDFFMQGFGVKYQDFGSDLSYFFYYETMFYKQWGHFLVHVNLDIGLGERRLTRSINETFGDFEEVKRGRKLSFEPTLGFKWSLSEYWWMDLYYNYYYQNLQHFSDVKTHPNLQGLSSGSRIGFGLTYGKFN